ncbi:DoxX family protein [Kineococcus indalonis]|uniref:DoxX family protein n=1 Tax=Kineococcus indalonis TaxID=2696566 RepID=UPI0014134D87|nr:DoxX family protein [Kineococcus indalonis]NAZ85154.1 DoxX family membrane protein [Kineococcus indalonis]
MDIGPLLVRSVVGGLFIGHGAQKLFGWFGGPGRAGTEAMMDALQLRPAKVQALVAGLGEAGGGALLLTGLATPLAASTLTASMVTAIRKVHLPNGVWVSNGGWEYNAVLIAAVLGVAETGPGAWSLDRLLGTERRGPLWALAAGAGGAAAAAIAMAAGARAAGAAASAERTDGEAVDAARGDTGGDPTTSGA